MRFSFRKSTPGPPPGDPPEIPVAEEAKSVFSLYMTARLLRQSMIRHARHKKLDILPEQYFLLQRIKLNPGQSQADLSHSSFEDRASISRTLATMERRSWIYKKIDTQDTRRYKVYLAKAGATVCDQFESVLKVAVTESLTGLSPKARADLERILAIIQGNLLETPSADVGHS